MTKLTSLIKGLRKKVNAEQIDNFREIKTFAKFSKPEGSKEPPLESYRLEENVFLNLKKILFYNNFFGQTDFNFGFGHQRFIDEGCNVTNCYATSNKSLLCELLC